MARSKGMLSDKSPSGQQRSSSRSPGPSSRPTAKGKHRDYSSEGVVDNDVFLLPVSDFQILGLLTVVAAMVRLFRIYQPTSVVFDEVQ
jgi:dolichyl-phosphate-mannose-protein mannosyltransferase